MAALTRKRSWAWALAGVATGLLLGLVIARLLGFGSGEVRPESGGEAATPELAHRPKAEGGAGGGESLGSRPVDPAYRTRAGGRFSPERFTDEQPIRTTELGAEDYSRVQSLVGWAASVATDDRVGCELARCRFEHLREVLGEAEHPACELRQRLYIQRGEHGQAFVSRVDSVLPPDHSPACAKLAECIRDAWIDRPAPLPEGRDALILDEKVYLGAEALTATTSDEQWTAMLEHAAQIQLESNRQRQAYLDEQVEQRPPEWRESMLHNLTLGELRIEDARQVGLWVSGERRSCEGV